MSTWIPWVVGGLLVVAFLFSRFARAGGGASEEAHALVAAGARLVDVRSPAEYAGGHIDGAINLPVGEIGRRSAEIGPKDAPVVVYCRSGARSAAAASTLRGQGFTRVVDVGAMSNW